MKKRLSMTVKQHPVLCLILFVQIVILLYLNLFKLDHFLGYDCSVYYLQAIEMWKQRTMFPSNWVYQTTLLLDSPVILAAPLYGLFNNIFVAYGVSISILSCIFFIVVEGIMKRLGMTVRAKLIAVVVLLTPFAGNSDASNNLSYYPMMYFAHGAYIFKITIIFLIYETFLMIDQQESTVIQKVSIICSVVACLFCGFSSGIYILIFGIMPVVGYYILRGIYKDRWKNYGFQEVFFLIACSIAQFAGKMLAKYWIGFESRDSQTIWVSLEKFWEDLQSIFLGWLKLMGALPVSAEVPVLSGEGIGFAVRMGICFIVTVGSVVLIKNKVARHEEKFIFWSVILALNILIFVPIYTTYGAPIFEERYLIPVFIIVSLFFATWLDQQNDAINHSFRRVSVVLSMLCLIISNVSCYRMIFASQNQFDVMKQIKDKIADSGAEVVYVIGSDLGILGRNMRVVDTSKIYKYSDDGVSPHHWGDYTYYDENSEYTGQTLLICTSTTFEQLPQYYTARCLEVDQVDNICIYESQQNIFDFASGLYDDQYNIDFPYTPNIRLSEHGRLTSDGIFVTDGTEEYALWGPYYVIEKPGIYDFTLKYVVENYANGIGNSVGIFDVAINNGQSILQQADIAVNATSITLKDVEITDEMVGSPLEYRVYTSKGASIEIKSIDIMNKRVR